MTKKKKTCARKAQRNNVPKTGPVWRMSAEEATLARMPKYNGYACSTGAHGDAKYNRAKQKRAWQKELNYHGARTRGLHLSMGPANGCPMNFSNSPIF